jgi:hypothetical protein
VSSITFHHDPTREEIGYISDNLRLADFEEFVMATGRHPRGLLVSRAMASKGTMIAKRDGRPAAVFGCVPQGRTGAPWLLGTDDIVGFDAARALVTTGSLLFEQWSQDYPDGLRHRAYATNKVHLRYLKALGCRIDEPKPYGPLGAMFREFHRV